MSTTAWRRILAGTACIQHLPVTSLWPSWSKRESQRRSRSSGHTLRLDNLSRTEMARGYGSRLGRGWSANDVAAEFFTPDGLRAFRDALNPTLRAPVYSGCF